VQRILNFSADGCVGLLPAGVNSTKSSIVASLVNKKLIDHAVFSVYTNIKGFSYIKFGNMDIKAFESNYSTIATFDNTSWALNVSSIEFGNKNLIHAGTS
jgi:hypothetical protein